MSFEDPETAKCWSYQIEGQDEINPWFQYALWSFMPLAVVYSAFPFKYVEGSMRLRIVVYIIRRYWKSIAAFIVLLWAVGLDVYVFELLQLLKANIRHTVKQQAQCGAAVPLDYDWYRHSRWVERRPNGPEMTLMHWIAIYDSKLAMSVMLAVLAILATLASVVFVALKLDFLHVLFNSVLLWLTTFVLLLTAQRGRSSSRAFHKLCSQTIVFFFCIMLPSVVALLATYAEDRASRLAYISKIRAERINTTLKLDLSTKQAGLENRSVGRDEKVMMEDVLYSYGMSELLRDVSVPFHELDLQEIIAKNTSGEVILADYHGTHVVLKRLALSTCTVEGLRAFRAKVELMACLRHPNVVQFIGATYDNLSNIGLVLEYLERGDVATLLRSSMTLTWNDPLLKIATDVAQGVSYLHNCDPPLVHRDLKSSNLLCTTTFSCKISDFGESKRQGAGNKLFSTVVGTPYWLAPEILREEKYDVSVDCYSFGIVLIELETRREPYFDHGQHSTIEIMLQVAQRGLRPTIPSSCLPHRRELIERCLSVDPKQRPAMTEILHFLQNEVRQEILNQHVFEDSHDKRRLMLMQRHQMLNRRGVGDLLQRQSSSDSERSSTEGD